jgi:uridylate kinase
MCKTFVPKYKRVLLKVTGEAIGSDDTPLNSEKAFFIAEEIKSIYDLGVDVGIVPGAGNILRGKELSDKCSFSMNRHDADYLGMVATILNGGFLKLAMEGVGVPVRHMSAIEIKSIAEFLIPGRIEKHLSKRRVVIFSGGTGAPTFTTDTAAVLRAGQMNADALLKGSHVDGVYTSDPEKDPNALLVRRITYEEAFRSRLKFVDESTVGQAMEAFRKSIHVFNIFQKGNLRRVVCGENIGSVVLP